MGLGKVGRVTSPVVDGVALVDIAGTPSPTQMFLLTSAGLTIGHGDWILVQVGLAVAHLGAREAADLMELLAQTAR